MTVVLSQAMVFAAGFGKRLRPLTDHIPKPLIPIQNTTCLAEVVRRLRLVGVTNIVINTHHLAPKIADHVASWGVRVVYEPTLLETGGGLLNALSHFDVSEPILTVNSDAWFCDQSSRCFETLASAWHKNMDALLLLVHKNNAVGYEGRGDYYMENTCLRYRYGAETPPFVYAGAQVIQPSSFLSFQPEGPIFSMKSVWDFLELQKKLHGVEYGGKWCDVGTHKALHEVQSGGQLLHRP